MSEALVDGFAHRTRSRTMLVGMTVSQISRQIGIAPGADAAVAIGGDVVGAPSGLNRAGEFRPVVESLEQVPRSVALSAMRHRLDEIGAAIPLWAALAVRLEPPVAIEQQRPGAHQPSLVERKLQSVGGRRRVDGRKTEE